MYSEWVVLMTIAGPEQLYLTSASGRGKDLLALLSLVTHIHTTSTNRHAAYRQLYRRSYSKIPTILETRYQLESVETPFLSLNKYNNTFRDGRAIDGFRVRLL